ncbi:hypothetical protein [Mycobacteroides abscessus]|uniref:hypothetical protein n=1 Tax=Mycobacteroides abscessus TaxID=36809 RepID=UPI0019D2C636|nr:hypothetical protein [Mycobacteroides abscessus]MBN7481030.1 hypothetical protein [Mycobacteroides abscessus subsp. massiliense]
MPVIFRTYGHPKDHVYAIHRRSDNKHIGYVERDCAREWCLREVDYSDYDRTEEGTIAYRTRKRAGLAMLEVFEKREAAAK